MQLVLLLQWPRVLHSLQVDHSLQLSLLHLLLMVQPLMDTVLHQACSSTESRATLEAVISQSLQFVVQCVMLYSAVVTPVAAVLVARPSV